jgi:hypothetical protein
VLLHTQQATDNARPPFSSSTPSKGARTPVHDDLTLWIETLRERLKGGELASLGSTDVGYGTGMLPGETVVRMMLADLDHCDEPPTSAKGRSVDVARRQALLEDFSRLRDLIG